MWKKVLMPALVVSLLWIAGSTTTTYFLQRVYQFHARALEENVASIRAAWAMQDALWRLHAVVVEAGGKELQETKIEVGELEESFRRHLAEAERTALSPAEVALVKAADEHFGVYLTHAQKRLHRQGLAELLVPQAADKEKTMRLARAVAEPCRQLVEMNERMLNETTARSDRLAKSVDLLRHGFMTAGPLVGIFCGLWVARGLHRSISQISITLRDATEGLDHEVGSVEVRGSASLPALQQQVQMVTNRIHQVAADLQEARRQAILAERLAAAGELAAGIAHEIRNPLTSVKLLIQSAAQRKAVPSWLQQDLQVTQQEIGRIEDTIQGLLEFARPPELHRVPHDLWATVRRSINLVESRAAQHRVTIVEASPVTPAFVNGDPDQLHQVLVNLLLNAIEAMPEGGTVRVSLEGDADPHGIARIVVSDCGAGIPVAILPRVFEPFVTNKPYGTGLGLAISHRIIEEHGGRLLAANQPNGGAVFTLELPLCQASRDRLPSLAFTETRDVSASPMASISHTPEATDAHSPGH